MAGLFAAEGDLDRVLVAVTGEIWLFTFIRLPKRRWQSASTPKAIARRSEAFRRRIKTQTVFSEARTAPMLFCALLAAVQIVMRRIEG